MPRWTREQVKKLAPDAASVKSAVGLARPGPWSDMGATNTMVWGKCQGSGKNPYQVSVDLTGPAFKCSCPSRKFPCKHGLALLMLWAESGGVVEDMASAPDHAADWATSRKTRAAAKPEDGRPADPEAQAKRLEERLAKMDAGLADFGVWLEDLVRQGLAAARAQPSEAWERTAARLVDAQAPGLADRVRAAARMVGSNEDWLEHLLDEVGRWHMAVEGWKRRLEIPEALVADLRTYLGWSRPSAEVLESGARLSGPWTVLGVSQDESGRILAQRTWLHSPVSGHAVMLDFATAGAAMRVPQVVGSVIADDLVAYPGSEPVRVMFADEPTVTSTARSLPASPALDNLDRIAAWLGTNPFCGPLPMTLRAAVPDIDEHKWRLIDEEASVIEVVAGVPPWTLAIECAAAPVDVFGEWQRGRFRPLSVASDRGVVSL